MITIYPADILQIVLFLAACYGCYFKGFRSGIEKYHEHLLEQNIIKESDFDE